jgi:hypothetical protein
MSQQHSFETIVEALASQRQRATYSAVAGLLDTAPRSLMTGRPRDPRHSWIVSTRSGQPTGYQPDQIDPELTSRPEVLRSHHELAAWLAQLQ